MLYKRSSFIKWLTEVKDCEIRPLENAKSGAVLIKNGSVRTYMATNSKDIIDYEEIYYICNRLYIVGIPGDSDLVRVE